MRAGSIKRAGNTDRNLAALAAIAIALLACGCSREEAAVETVAIETADGVQIVADLAGEGNVGLVLAHGMKYLDGKDSFRSELLDLPGHVKARESLTVMAISFRGYPATAVPPVRKGRDLDIDAAVRFLAGRGCGKVFVLGSSMGGWAALAAAPALLENPAFAGLVLISAGDPGAADDIALPKLIVVAKDDALAFERVTSMERTAAEPKTTIIFDSGGHGQVLFETRRTELLDAIAEFVTKEG